MPDGARFCIACGAEHDSNGQLIQNSGGSGFNRTVILDDMMPSKSGGGKIDYNKTMMAADVPHGKVDYDKTMMAADVPHGKIDYDKTMMAADVPHGKIDYDKTMMAADVPHGNIDYDKTMMAADVPHDNNSFGRGAKKGKTKKKSPVAIVAIILILIVGGGGGAFFMMKTKKEQLAKKLEAESIAAAQAAAANAEGDTSATLNGQGTSKNTVTDFKAQDGYWSRDNEFFFRNGVVQRNQWIGDYYVGPDGKKLKNQVIDDTYYVDGQGRMVRNEWYVFTRKINGVDTITWYYFGPDGKKMKDTLTPDGYYVDKDGIYIPGLHDSPDSESYIPEENK